ncbi:hypothetical protein V1477_001544, partial [Vespula maculifrons]
MLRRICRRVVRSSTRGKEHWTIFFLICNILYEIFDNWRYNGIIVLHSPIGTSSASKISPQFYDYLFTPSNITASYEAYSCTIADKSLSLYLSGLEKPSDRYE